MDFLKFSFAPEMNENISALASKKRSNQKNKGTLYHYLKDFILALLHYFFDFTSFYRLG